MNARIPATATTGAIDGVELQSFVDSRWDDSIVERLVNYVAIPAKSPWGIM